MIISQKKTLDKSVEILKHYWGFDSFRKKQDQIIQSILDKKDTLALLPTGGGKSICYQIPAIQLDGTCLVISPLIALMQDQVDHLKKKGIKAVAITSAMSKREIDIQLDNAIYGDVKFLYVSPERLKNKVFLARFEKMNINLIAVDEAHCISEWGYDFRPSYLEIADLRKIKSDTPILALTATATPNVVVDIQSRLEFKTPHVISDSFNRENLTYNTLQSNNKLKRIEEIVLDNTSSGIIYCATRKNVKELSKHLISKGVSASFYHGGLDYEKRKERQNSWMNNETLLMVCTNAFGMGIDKPDVKYVLHYDIPETIEAYFQEAGRAGRNGETAKAYLCYEPVDIEKLEEKVALKYPPIDTIKLVYKAIGNHLQLAIGSGKDEQYPFNTLAFSQKYELDLLTVHNAIHFLSLANYLRISDQYKVSSKLKITCTTKELYHYQLKDKEVDRLIQFILRTQMGVFEDFVHFNESKASQHTGLSEKTIVQKLEYLHDLNLICYTNNSNGTYITFLTERLTDANLSIPSELHYQRKKLAFEKLEAMKLFLTTASCSSVFLLEYFGENDVENCNNCNRCKTQVKEKESFDSKQFIINYINKEFNNRDFIEIQELIATQSPYSKQTILEQIRVLVDLDQIAVDDLGQKIMKP